MHAALPDPPVVRASPSGSDPAVPPELPVPAGHARLVFASCAGTAALTRAVLRLHSRGADVTRLDFGPAPGGGSQVRAVVGPGVDPYRLGLQLSRDVGVRDVRVHLGPPA